MSISFSILICNYNYAQFVSDAIESCLNQDYPEELFEVIVVDDASTDNSREVLEKYKSNNQVKIIYQENSGQLAAIQNGLMNAQNNYICLLDADDYFLPNKLAGIQKKLLSYKNLNEYIFITHDLKMLQDKKLIAQTWFDLIGIHSLDSIDLNLVSCDFPYSVTSGHVYSRKLLLDLIKGITVSDWKYDVDNVLGHAALFVTGVIYYIHEPLAVYRIHNNNEFSAIDENGNYKPKRNWKQAWPKLLKFLECFLDSSDLSIDDRAQRLKYIRSIERQLRISSSAFKHSEAKVSYICTNLTNQTLSSIKEQSHTNSEVIELNNTDNTNILKQLTQAYTESTGSYIVFLDGNTILKKYFLERHLYHHQYSAICTLTSSDLNLLKPTNELLFSGLFRSQLWKEDLNYIPPLTTKLSPCLPAILQTCCFRRTNMLNVLFQELASTNYQSLNSIYDWLIISFSTFIGGHLQINECLSSLIYTKPIDNIQFSNYLQNDLILRNPHIDEIGLFILNLINNNFGKFENLFFKQGLNKLIEYLVRSFPSQTINYFIQTNTSSVFTKNLLTYAKTEAK